MALRVTCTLPNASEEISGVAFTRVDAETVTAEVDAATAAIFDGIPGYAVVDLDVDADAERQALMDKLTAAGVAFDKRMGVAKLRLLAETIPAA